MPTKQHGHDRFMRTERIIASIFVFVALIGLADALYLTSQHYVGIIPPCYVTTGCETVLTSAWNKIAGIPVSLLGAIYYALICTLATYFLIVKKEKALTVAAWATFIGLFGSLWFVSLQLFIIKSICFYCMVSAATSSILFITGSVYIFKKRKFQTIPNETLSS